MYGTGDTAAMDDVVMDDVVIDDAAMDDVAIDCSILLEVDSVAILHS